MNNHSIVKGKKRAMQKTLAKIQSDRAELEGPIDFTMKPNAVTVLVMTKEALAAFDALPEFYRTRLLAWDFCIGYYLGKHQ